MENIKKGRTKFGGITETKSASKQDEKRNWKYYGGITIILCPVHLAIELFLT